MSAIGYRLFLVLLGLGLFLGLSVVADGWGSAHGQTPGVPTITRLTSGEEADLPQCAGEVIRGFRVEGSGQVSIGVSEFGTLPATLPAWTAGGHACTYGVVRERCTLVPSTYNLATQAYSFTADASGIYGFYFCAEGVTIIEITLTGGQDRIPVWLVAVGVGLGLAGFGLFLRRRSS